MRFISTLFAAAFGMACVAGAEAQTAPTGPALGQALAAGQIDAASFDFGALRYTPGKTLAFLAAESAAQGAIAQAHGKPNWPAISASHVCLSPAERLTVAGFDSALVAPDAQAWAADKAQAEAAYARYDAARDAILAGQSTPYPEFAAEAQMVAAAASARQPELKALYLHKAADALWRRALVFGGARSYAEGVGKAGVIWLNARVTNEGCAVDAAAAQWLKTTLATVSWFDIKTYGKAADEAAWLIAEHADADPDVQLLALDRMGQRVIDHQSDPGAFAYLWDRVALNTGRPQRYGTQMHCIGAAWGLVSPVEDVAKLDERRGWVGLGPEAEFIRKGQKACGG